jgi:hypothetical protein
MGTERIIIALYFAMALSCAFAGWFAADAGLSPYQFFGVLIPAALAGLFHGATMYLKGLSSR